MTDTKAEFIGLRVDPALKKLIQKAANKEGRTLSNYIVNLLLATTKE